MSVCADKLITGTKGYHVTCLARNQTTTHCIWNMLATKRHASGLFIMHAGVLWTTKLGDEHGFQVRISSTFLNRAADARR